MPRGSIGWLLRDSVTTNAPMATTPATSESTTLGAPQPRSPAPMSPQLSAPSDSATSAAPVTSIWRLACGSNDSGTCRAAMATTATDSGRLMRKIQRHDAASTSQPPTKGPMAAATPDRPDHAPMARGRSSGLKLASRMARLAGVSSAPPIPWATRPSTSAVSLGASAHATDASREQDDAGLEHALAPEQVAQRPAEQDQGRQRHEVAVEHPLQPGDAGVEVLADVGQGDVDHRRVQEGDARAQHRGRDHPPALGGGEHQPHIAI